MLPITDTDRIAYFDAVFLDWIGGAAVMAMLISHHRGQTYREIAEQHGVSVSTAHSWITAAKVKLRRCGLHAEAIDRSAEAPVAGPS